MGWQDGRKNLLEESMLGLSAEVGVEWFQAKGAA